ncbi:MAG: DUF4412 domain-containing protein [Desulfobacterales bacterium]
MESANRVHRNTWAKFFLVILVCFIMAPLSSHALLGGKIESFSADQVMISPAGKVMSTSKLYITPDVYRMDGLPTGGQGGITRNLSILGFKKQNKQYIYKHDKKLFFESQLDENDMLEKMKSSENVDSERVLGKGKVSGYNCVKKEVTTTMTMMGTKITTTQIVWVSDRFEFPLRTKMEDGQIMEFRNIDKGEPSKKLFRRLTGYKKVDNMMAAMGMDFGAMAREEAKSDDDKQQAAPEDISDVDVEEMMATMKQAMGENADPEQMAQMQQIMTQALDLDRARQTSEDEGAADGLWKVIPKRAGDKLGYEMKAPDVYDVIMGTNASLKQVFTFYKQKLTPEGWKDAGMYLQDGQGNFSMTKGAQRVIISWADNPGMEGNYKLFYNLQLSGPDI